jgi:secreted trypsin-like serine protease
MRPRHARRGFAALAAAVVTAGMTVAMPTARAGVSAQIIGGGPVDASSAPWTVAVLDRSEPDPYQAQFCGGSLIHARWVLTAAHCVVGRAAGSVDVAWGRTRLSHITSADRRSLSRIIVHPRYRGSTSEHDVALLELSAPATGATTVALHTGETSPTFGASLRTYGWGTTSTSPVSYPDELHGVTLTDRAGPTGACGSYGPAYVAELMLCAGWAGGGRDACWGDSGGPLVTDTATPVLVGVTSWGNGCALAAYPGVWARVSSHVPWINAQISPVPPRVSVGDATVVEGDSGSRSVAVTLTLSSPATGPVAVPWATGGGSATAGADFTPAGGTVTFKPGNMTKLVTVRVLGDTAAEGAKTFSLTLGAPSGGGATVGRGTGTVTILDDDPGGGIRLAVGDARVVEGNDGKAIKAKLTVSLSAPSATDVTFTWATAAATASGDRDFTPRSKTASIRAGRVSTTITLSVTPDWLPELGVDETFTVTLSSVVGATVTRGGGTVTILADD